MLYVDGHRVVVAVLTETWHGRWTLDVKAEEAVVMNGKVVFSIADVGEWHGAVVRSGVEQGAYRARIVGGGGGWGKALERRPYSFGSVQRSQVLKDAASECGESVSLDSAYEASLGSHYVRLAGPASRVLEGLPWYVGRDGITYVAERSGDLITSHFDFIGARYDRGIVTIATDTPQDWVPGRRFESDFISSKTISCARHTWQAERCRSEIWYAEAT